MWPVVADEIVLSSLSWSRVYRYQSEQSCASCVHLVFFNSAYFQAGIHVRCTPSGRVSRVSQRKDQRLVSVPDGLPADFPIV